MIEPGTMHQNGHGCCGGCGVFLRGCPGGRKRRKRSEGWTYTGADRLGWVCGSCVTWARDSTTDPAQPNPSPRPLIAAPTRGTARGFGAERPQVRLIRARLANRRRRAIQKERKAGPPIDFDAMSCTDYREYWRARKERPR